MCVPFPLHKVRGLQQVANALQKRSQQPRAPIARACHLQIEQAGVNVKFAMSHGHINHTQCDKTRLERRPFSSSLDTCRHKHAVMPLAMHHTINNPRRVYSPSHRVGRWPTWTRRRPPKRTFPDTRHNSTVHACVCARRCKTRVSRASVRPTSASGCGTNTGTVQLKFVRSRLANASSISKTCVRHEVGLFATRSKKQ